MTKMKKAPKIILLACGVITVGAALAVNAIPSDEVMADNLCVSAKCKEAEAKEAAARAEQEKAAAQKGSYQAEVQRFAAEITSVQAQIDRDEEEITELNARIDNTQKKIDNLRESLKTTLVKLYLSNDVSEFEILASSESVADFTTKSANQSVVQGKVKQLAIEAKEAKEELSRQKTELETKVANNQARRSDLATKQSEQQAFVNEWSGKETLYADVAKKNEDIKNAEREAQRQANLAKQNQWGGQVINGGSGGYPYNCPAAWDKYVDPWGMYTCECVSYAAFKVSSSYGNMPYWGGRGNANQWVSNATSAGIPVSTTPKAGTVAVMLSGYYGHVAWVESVSGDMIYISQYNWGVNGMYSEMWISRYAFDYYIYFGG